MNNPYSIVFQKEAQSAPLKDLLDNFSIVCTSFPYARNVDTKELPKNDWFDENGEDVFIPPSVKFKAYDITIGLCYCGVKGTGLAKINSLRNYLSGVSDNCASMKIYNSHTGFGRKGVYLKSFGEMEFSVLNGNEIIEFDITLGVTDPATDISMNSSNTALT